VSQQQLVPEPQDESTNGSQENEALHQHLYKPRNSNMPKDEHPSTFEETIPPYSYRAQDRAAQNQADAAHSAHFHETNARVRQARRQRFSPDGDALENGYRPYQQQQYSQVPPWARPQQQRNSHALRWFIIIVMAIVLIKPLLILIGGLFLAGLTALGIIILIPFIILGLLIIVGFVLAMLGRAMWRW
jgi:hypothetical protein